MNLTSEQFIDFTTKNLDWIHLIEARIGRRMTNEELYSLHDMIALNGWDNYVEEQKDLMRAIHVATTNFMEGIR